MAEGCREAQQALVSGQTATNVSGHDAYVRVGPTGLMVSSSPWRLTEAFPVPDRTAVSDMLHYPLLPASPERSLLKGVARWPAGTTAVVQGDRFKLLNPAVEPIDKVVAIAEAVESVDIAIRGSIERAVAGRRQPAVLVTGGLDSSVVAAVVRAVTGQPPLLLSIRGGLSSRREQLLQDQLAAALQAQLTYLDDVPPWTLEPLLRLNRGSDFPRGGVFTHVWDAAAALAHHAGADLILTGEGGNEVFASSRALSAELLHERRPVEALWQAGRTRQSDGSGVIASFAASVRYSTLPTKIQSSQKTTLRAWRGSYAADETAAARRRRSQLRRLRFLGLTPTQADAFIWLERVDLYAAADSTGTVAIRHPLAEDLAVRQAVARVPASLRCPVSVASQDKHLLRLIARRYLPAGLTEQRKTGLVNQISVLTKKAGTTLDDRLVRSARWLGLNLPSEFHRPDLLAPELGLDWTQMLALLCWATNATGRTP